MHTTAVAPGALLGYTKHGRPIYLAAGGNGEGDSGDGEDAGQNDGQNDTDTGADQEQRPKKTGDDEPTVAQLQQQLKDARAEAGKNRVNAKLAAAEEAREALTADIAKALGLTKDGDKALDPKALADQLAAKDKEAKSSAVQLAVYRNASKAGADPEAVTDSKTALAAVEKLDTSADDFNTKVVVAMKKAIENNPKLKAEQVSAKSGAPIPGGSGDRTNSTPTLSGAVAARYGAK